MGATIDTPCARPRGRAATGGEVAAVFILRRVKPRGCFFVLFVPCFSNLQVARSKMKAVFVAAALLAGAVSASPLAVRATEVEASGTTYSTKGSDQSYVYVDCPSSSYQALQIFTCL